MTDNTSTIESLKSIIKHFTEEREWQQFHSPKNMSMQISIEAAELMELFLWASTEQSWKELENKKESVRHEVADVAITLLNFCIRTNIDLANAIVEKMALNAKKYPLEKSKGNSAKYTEL